MTTSARPITDVQKTPAQAPAYTLGGTQATDSTRGIVVSQGVKTVRH
jgi:hypothetical protein